MTRVFAANVRVFALELAREPMSWALGIGFPVGFFVLALPDVHSGQEAAGALGRMTAFAAMLVAIFQLPPRIAQERTSTWETFVRVLPGRASVRLGARAVIGLGFVAAAGVALLALALATTPVSESAVTWLLWFATVLAGSVPFVLLGIGLGYAVRPKAVSPLVTLAFLPLLYLSGFIVPPEEMPAAVRQISLATPIRQYGDLLISITDPSTSGLTPLWLLLWAVGLGALAVLAYRRDEGTRYR